MVKNCKKKKKKNPNRSTLQSQAGRVGYSIDILHYLKKGKSGQSKPHTKPYIDTFH